MKRLFRVVAITADGQRIERVVVAHGSAEAMDRMYRVYAEIEVWRG